MPEKNVVSGKEFTDEEVGEIDKGNARVGTKYRHGGKWYYFSTLAERQQFMGDPDKYKSE